MAHKETDQDMQDVERKQCNRCASRERTRESHAQREGYVRDPSWQEREHHEATGHVRYAERCKHCVSGRGQSSHHKQHHQRGRNVNAVPAISLD